ncbi:glycosyltransferase family 2 protein [Rhodopseudomonas sp. HC1]|uniref:glycosyltransferase n=1 Tax=Rhodopseudomonas infernalis TaxID=2897386 RepID=UPI001EE80C9D|nr:glycosyltransferase family A protein [Rhodopseudomonas infernalis]MCG6205862.1 glycosyltransferase family 2 protein [Rhodopseudomonas infernalis]
MKADRSFSAVRAVVAIPAHNEAQRIRRCLSALAMQRDEAGAPVRTGAFEILIFANNCTDDTAAVVRAFAALVPHPVVVIEAQLPPDQLSAGRARKQAMDLAAARLIERGAIDGVILTTDADSCVAPTWFAATMREMQSGVDCVAGYIDAEPLEIVDLGSAFLTRGRMEDTYLRLLAEIDARCDPRPHDPWPNHRVSSGASLALTLASYQAIGGLPPRPVGEDSALTAALERAGFKVRHSMAVSVVTSCRLDGRAQGGAADTMRLRHQQTDAPCDDDLEPALQATRRSIYRGHLRRLLAVQPAHRDLPRGWQVSQDAMRLLSEPGVVFEEAWRRICCDSPALQRGAPLRPSDLPRQIAVANMILRQLRRRISSPPTAPADKPRPSRWLEPAA